MSKQTEKPEKRVRFAIYCRYSSEQQNELSLEDQEKFCRRAIAERGGVVINVYTDAARSGWSLDRDGFTQLRNDAERDKFDAVMFWKFDRLARNREHAVMIKILLRREYGLKLHCVEGFSEDDDDSPYTAMMEQLLAVFYAFYSKNLSTDTKRAKVGRVEEGKFNGSIAPIGYDLVKQAEATPERPAGLHINCRVAAVVRRAFRMYVTGNYADGDIAAWMNKKKSFSRSGWAANQWIKRSCVTCSKIEPIPGGCVMLTPNILALSAKVRNHHAIVKFGTRASIKDLSRMSYLTPVRKFVPRLEEGTHRQVACTHILWLIAFIVPAARSTNQWAWSMNAMAKCDHRHMRLAQATKRVIGA